MKLLGLFQFQHLLNVMMRKLNYVIEKEREEGEVNRGSTRGGR